MQPSWTPGASLPPEVASALVAQCSSLLQRIVEIERALTSREWWLLGRVIPEAGPLAEIASLLAVARGELEQALEDQFDWRMTVPEWDASLEDGDPDALASDPDWVRERRAEAAGALRMLSTALPAMQSFAEQLRANVEYAGMAPAALDALGIVLDRLIEAIETLRQPAE
jgi:hypothetical protein